MFFIFNILILIISIIVGATITSFTILSAVICLTFCVPLTKDLLILFASSNLEKEKLIVKNNPIIKRYRGSAAFLTIIFCIITFLVFKFGSSTIQIGYGLGFFYVFFKIIFNINQIGINQGNISDYVGNDSNIKFFNMPVDAVLNIIAIKVGTDHMAIVASKLARRDKNLSQADIKTCANKIFEDANRIEPETDEGKFTRTESQKYALHITQLVRVGTRTTTDEERESQIRNALKK